jgi:hypothetical protein
MPCRHHYEVCLYMLRGVFLLCIEECNIKDIGSEFVQELLSRSLQTNPNITRLILPHHRSFLVSRFVLSDLHRLRVLKEIIWLHRCSDPVGKTLQIAQVNWSLPLLYLLPTIVSSIY